ncbi:hypothetical protein CAI21_07715 [Alkalilimnicola ehrlichii]|uniref:Lipid A biosynthesis acyltransferase n=2 Tax=Alkalilimnicola ehrlichii TaxID=351052 RepID=A0A3E0WZH9_9GAMM|nr:hypothetical protein CAI21_07715 [Alkalilimnicola ehrlichii]RFA37426.1 hypothetical protein CAL65_09055 [Alkalilimnicola ehrlichii]
MESLPKRALRPRYWPNWIGMGLLWCLAQLPYRWATAIGRGAGRLLYPIARHRRQVAERNIELCFPELDLNGRNDLVKRNFVYTGKAFAEIALSWWAPRRRLQHLIELSGTEHLEAAQAKGRGVILLSCHFTSLEIMPPLIAPTIPAYAIYKKQRNPVVEYCMRSARDRSLLGAIPRDDIRGIMRALKENRPVWYAADQDYGRKHSVFVPFFGVETATITGLSRLAKMNNSPVVPFFFHSRADQRGYEAVFLPALENFPTDDPKADAARINAIIEEAVRRYPDQYLWTHRRFKTRPNKSDPNPYNDRRKK